MSNHPDPRASSISLILIEVEILPSACLTGSFDGVYAELDSVLRPCISFQDFSS